MRLSWRPSCTRASRRGSPLRRQIPFVPAWWLAALLAFLAPSPAKAQYLWRIWRAQDGLAESLTRSVTLNPRGAVWARHGEVDAISRLDGYLVQRIPSPGGQSQRVFQSRGGMVWTTYPAGLELLVGGAWQRHPLPALQQAEAINPLGSLRRTPILPISEDRVFVLLPGRLLQYRGMSGATTVIREAELTVQGRFIDLARAPNDSLWVTTKHGLLHFPAPLRRIGTNTVPHWYPLPTSPRLLNPQHPVPTQSGELYAVAEAPDQERRVGLRFDGASWEVRAFPGENPRFAWPMILPGGWWAVTYRQLLQAPPAGQPPLPTPFRPGQFYDFAMEPGGGFWLATSEGLAHAIPAAWRAPTANALRDQEIAAALPAPDGALWIAAQRSLVRYDPKNDTERVFPWPAGLDPDFRAGDRPHRLPDGRLVLAPANQLWVWTPDDGAFHQVRHPAGGRPRKVLHQLDDGRLCLLVELPRQTTEPGRFELFDGERFTAWTNGPPPLDLGGELFFLEQARNGDWWLGGSRGVARWRDQRWQRFSHLEGYADEGAICWLERPDGRIWCGGLNLVSEFDGKRWTTIHSGLDRVWEMRQASDHSVWVATGNGLHRHFQGTWSSVDTQEGLPAEVVHTVVEDAAHRIWAGTARGLVRHHPEADIEPPVTFEPTWEPVRDPESDTTIRFAFEGRDKWRFTPDDRLLFSYRVDEGEWSPFHPARQVVLQDLPSGHHRFMVRAMDRNWNLQDQTTLTSFTVTLPWFKEPRVLAAVLAVLASLAFAVNRHFKLRRSYAEVERQVAKRTAELKQATEALVQSQKMTALGTLAAGIAHDFNNILSIIRGSAQIIAGNLTNPDKILTRVRRIESGVEQASGVVLAMLGFARASEHRPAPCAVETLIDETFRLLGDRFRREIRLRRRLEPNLPPVVVVRDLVQQMLLNLILNAADALGGQGEIRVTARRFQPAPHEWSLNPAAAPAYVELLVQDSGAGIPPEVRPRIFEPFFSTKPFSKRHGTGLGLYMVYEFAREMGLGLRLESDPDHGTTFFIVLPVAAPGETSHTP